tara:strand:+ start:37 stop:549 length:513 start_codon:yes stop_codon:yes gene_type:complete
VLPASDLSGGEVRSQLRVAAKGRFQPQLPAHVFTIYFSIAIAHVPYFHSLTSQPTAGKQCYEFLTPRDIRRTYQYTSGVPPTLENITSLEHPFFLHKNVPMVRSDAPKVLISKTAVSPMNVDLRNNGRIVWVSRQIVYLGYLKEKRLCQPTPANNSLSDYDWSLFYGPFA